MEERGRRKDWSKSEVVSEGVEGKGKASQPALWNVTRRASAGSLLDTSPMWLFSKENRDKWVWATGQARVKSQGVCGKAPVQELKPVFTH